MHNLHFYHKHKITLKKLTGDKQSTLFVQFQRERKNSYIRWSPGSWWGRPWGRCYRRCPRNNPRTTGILF